MTTIISKYMNRLLSIPLQTLHWRDIFLYKQKTLYLILRLNLFVNRIFYAQPSCSLLAFLANLKCACPISQAPFSL